jgi:hypothetical protein
MYPSKATNLIKFVWFLRKGGTPSKSQGILMKSAPSGSAYYL